MLSVTLQTTGQSPVYRPLACIRACPRGDDPESSLAMSNISNNTLTTTFTIRSPRDRAAHH
jgi:hypothetical protein